MLLDRASGRQTSLTDAFDRSVEDHAVVERRPNRSSSTPKIAARCRCIRFAAAGGTPRPITAGHVRRRIRPRRRCADRRAQQPRRADASCIEVDRVTGAATPLTRHNATRLAALDLAKAEAVHLRRRRRHADPRHARQAAGVRREPEVSGDHAAARRTADPVGRLVELPLERPRCSPRPGTWS